MQRTIMLTAAVLAVVLVSVSPAVPAQSVSPDCTHDYDIPDAEPIAPRSLGTTGNAVGRVIVDDVEDVTVRVELSTSEDILKFGVFYDATECDDAWTAGLSTCKTSEELKTNLLSQRMDCDLDKAESGQERHYFFVYENGGNSSLGYKDWIL